MEKLAKKYVIRIPDDIKITYCDNSNILIFEGPTGKKSMKLQIKITILSNEKKISVTRQSVSRLSNNQKKRLKIIQGTTVSLIKQLMLDVSVSFSKKLNFIGVGYRAIPMEICGTPVYHLKLGYSHDLYVRAPENTQFACLKFTNFFISANSYSQLTQLAAVIRFYKKPEPYKGKGILYSDETIKLKQGKKV